MPRYRLAAAAVNTTPLDWNGNRKALLAALEAARENQVAVLCLPELCICGYGCEDAFFAPGVQQMALDVLQEVVPATRGMAVAMGLPLVVSDKLYNAAALVVDGRVSGFVCKQTLAGDGIHYEPRWFHPWPVGGRVEFELAGNAIPAGDLLFDCGDFTIGMEICRDAWVADRPCPRLAAGGANVVLNPSASHFAFAKQEIRRRIALEASSKYGVAYVYSNLLGNESGRAIYDGGSMIAHGDHVIAAARRFSYQQFTLTSADVDLQASASTAGRGIVSCHFAPAAISTAALDAEQAFWDVSQPPKEEEFARAVALGLHDYLRKSGARGFVVSLSGGADSSSVAALIWVMAKLGTAELGRERFAGQLRLICRDSVGIEDFMAQLLFCVYQQTRNSGDVTRNAAEVVAKAIGAKFRIWNVDEVIDGYVDRVTCAMGGPLKWDTDDVALQNIQARARGPGIWLLANVLNALLLTTSNRSEAAVGYATMDGDTCGGLAPIAGIDKACFAGVAAVDGNDRSAGSWPPASAGCRHVPAADRRTPPPRRSADGRRRPDAVSCARRDRAGRNSRPHDAGRGLRSGDPAVSQRCPGTNGCLD